MGVPKCLTVKFYSQLFLTFFPKYARHHRFFNHFPLFTSILNVILWEKKFCRTFRAVGHLGPLQLSALSAACDFKSHFWKDQTSDQGPHCLPVCKNRFEKFARIFSRRHFQMLVLGFIPQNMLYVLTCTTDFLFMFLKHKVKVF